MGYNVLVTAIVLRPKSGGRKAVNLSTNSIKDAIHIFRNFKRRRCFRIPDLNQVLAGNKA